MKLIICDKEAKIGQKVQTCRGAGILLDWREPCKDLCTQSGDSDPGEVTVKEPWNDHALCFYPSAINGEFV